MNQIILIAHNLRSAHNVGSLLRTAEGLGVQQVFLTGYTPYPSMPKDERLPHIALKVDRQIAKTALGAERTIGWQHAEDIMTIINDLKRDGFTIAALEQTPRSVVLPKYKAAVKIAVIAGREVEGLEPEIIKHCDLSLEIPMFGQKESFNVAQAVAMSLYHLRFVEGSI